MMKVPPLSLVGMERLPLPLPFSPDLLWRYHQHQLSQQQQQQQQHHGPHTPGPPPSPSAAATALVLSRAAAAGHFPHSPLPTTMMPFSYDIKQTIPMGLGPDPTSWSREDVVTFLRWCEREFEVPPFDLEGFQMNGRALCLLTKADLETRAPSSGTVIHNALHLLLTTAYPYPESPLTPQTPSCMRMLSITHKDLHYAASQQNGTTSVTLSPAPSLDGHTGSPPEIVPNGNGTNLHLSSSASSSSSAANGGNHSDDSEYDSINESPERSPTVGQPLSLSPPLGPQQHTSMLTNSFSNSSGAPYIGTTLTNGTSRTGSPSQLSPFTKSAFQQGSGSNSRLSNGADSGEYNNNGRLLWDFLQQLLNDPSQRYNSYIAWKNMETGIFKIVDPPGLARLWGIQKNHLSMNYDKMSRALRYYYRVNILRKVQGERHCYQFLRNPGELKSIKNISMLRNQESQAMRNMDTPRLGTPSNSFVSVKSEPSSYVECEYMYDDMPTDLSMESERHMKVDEDIATDLSIETTRYREEVD